MKLQGKSLFTKPLLLIPFFILVILEVIGLTLVPEGIPPMGQITLSIMTLLSSFFIYNRYVSRDMEQYLKSEVLQRTKALQESESRFRSLVTNIPGTAYRSLPDSDRTMIYVSPNIRELTGYSDDDLIANRDRTFASIVHPEDGPALLEHMAEAFNSGSEFNLEYRIIRNSGDTRWILDRGMGIRDGENRIRYIDGVLFDITREKRLLREKMTLEKQYLQAQKMESVGRLAGGISHDLNNLLTPILGYAELIASLLPQGEEAWVYTQRITKASLSARDLIRQLLTYSRNSDLPKEEIDLNALLEGFSGLLRKSIREEIDMEYILSPESPRMLGNITQLEQVVMNLAVNGQDAIEGRGKITLGTEIVGDQAFLTVADTGVGMDGETEEHLFEPFFTTKGIWGTGLGLATVFGIIQEHGGKIETKSRKGEGTLFRISFARLCRN